MDLNPRQIAELFLSFASVIIYTEQGTEDNTMKMTARLRLTDYEIRVAINALNARRLKMKANGLNHSVTSGLILNLIETMEQ